MGTPKASKLVKNVCKPKDIIFNIIIMGLIIFIVCIEKFFQRVYQNIMDL